MNGRIEREGGSGSEVISITRSRDGGASWADGQDRKPGMYETWQDAAWRLGSVLAAWALFCWFVSILVRGRGAAGWEVAGMIAGLIAVSATARRRAARARKAVEREETQ